jgi:hypothetical protein
VYQRALALIAALFAVHCVWSAMNADANYSSDAVLVQIANIAPARILGLRPAVRRTSQYAALNATSEHSATPDRSAPPPHGAPISTQSTERRRSGGLTMDALWAP